MVFVMGPRQVGKTTSSLTIKKEWGDGQYFNWDKISDRNKILKGCDAIAEEFPIDQLREKIPLFIFNEIHKYSDWKNFLKGFYDSYPDLMKILVTGSARLDVFKRGGDSLMGRYFHYHFHPLSVSEIINANSINETELRTTPQPIHEDEFQALLKYGGFPDPFLKRDDRFSRRWKSLRFQQLFEEDVRDMTRVQEISQMELLAELLRHHIGSLTSYESLASQVKASGPTIRRWIEILKSFYYCFEIRPYSHNIARSLLKEPKYYLWDWALCEEGGGRLENFVASHFLKAIDFWNDLGLGDYQLHFLRDKQQREVDFAIIKNGIPWMLLEVKSSINKGISPSLHYFQQETNAPYAFQLALDMPYVNTNCFETKGRPMRVPLRTFLSQLV
ncbi:MAG: ATP-binding protein [Parachlamydiaceae bacterium]|nr:ATP-binding protein [Parachlamydiaceae bacterium]